MGEERIGREEKIGKGGKRKGGLYRNDWEEGKEEGKR